MLPTEYVYKRYYQRFMEFEQWAEAKYNIIFRQYPFRAVGFESNVAL